MTSYTVLRKAIANKAKDLICFVAIYEAHCILTCRKDFRPSYAALSYMRQLLPSTPFMLLSATLPPQLESEVASACSCMHLRKPYKRVLTSLDLPNIFYEVKKKQSLEIDLRHLLSCLQLSESPDEVPKTLIFVFSKETCYKIYCYLWQKVNERKRSLFAQFHALMREKHESFSLVTLES